jgi:subtilase family serine protease
MNKWALFPLLGVMVLLGASLSFTQSTGSQHGVVIVPDSSQEMPWDVGYRAHTNHLIMVRPGFTGTSPSGETPGSLGCVYQTNGVALSTGCPTSTATLNSGGSGIIAIVDAFDYPTAQTDFDTFSSQFGLPLSTSTCGSGPCFQKVFATGHKPRANCGWAQEAALDIEWSHAMAPNAQIVLVEAASNSFSNLFAAVDVATNIVAGKGEVSMSWGGSEFSSESSNDFHFNNSGVVYFASSGDTGGKVIYPSASPNVVSAGGTSVNRSGGSFTGESAWSSGGGGPSADEPRPGYQSAVATIVGSQRGTPDFSFDSDPNTGVSVFDSTSCQGFSGWQVFGGTSVASPSLSGIVNLASHFSSTTNSELTMIYGNLGNTSDFRDITSGSNGYPTLTGYDLATGVGSNLGKSGK